MFGQCGRCRVVQLLRMHVNRARTLADFHPVFAETRVRQHVNIPYVAFLVFHSLLARLTVLPPQRPFAGTAIRFSAAFGLEHLPRPQSCNLQSYKYSKRFAIVGTPTGEFRPRPPIGRKAPSANAPPMHLSPPAYALECAAGRTRVLPRTYSSALPGGLECVAGRTQVRCGCTAVLPGRSPIQRRSIPSSCRPARCRRHLALENKTIGMY